MNKTRRSSSTVLIRFRRFLSEPFTSYSLIIILSISMFIVLQSVYPQFVTWTASKGFYWLQEQYPTFATSEDKLFFESFVQWIGVLYAVFLPIVFVKQVEQFERLDQEFEREADTINTLHEVLVLLDDATFLVLKLHMIRDLHAYCKHIIEGYKMEALSKNDHLVRRGDALLQGIKIAYKNLIYRGGGERASQLEPVTTELLILLSNAISIRASRITLSRQKATSGALQSAVFAITLLWLVPIYFLDFKIGFLSFFLKLAATFAIIVVLAIMDDIRDPFSGLWKINLEPWEEISTETEFSIKDLEKKASEPPKIDNHVENNSRPTPAKTKMTYLALLQMLWAGVLSLVYLWFVLPKHNQKK